MNNMTEKETIIQSLGNLVKKHSNSGISHKLSYTMKRWELELVADWIIIDRREYASKLRLVCPLCNTDHPNGLCNKIIIR